MHQQADKPTFEKIEMGVPFAPPYDYDRQPEIIKPAEWKHLCSARFGESRQSSLGGRVRWTGDSYRYDIFERKDSTGRRELALRWWNGAGQGWLLTDDRIDLCEANMLDLVAAVPDEARRWDYCHFLWQTAHKSAVFAERRAATELKRAFVEGRLKKRKAKGVYSVIVEPRAG